MKYSASNREWHCAPPQQMQLVQFPTPDCRRVPTGGVVFPGESTATVVHLIAGRYLIAGTPPNLTQVKIWEYLNMETLIEHDYNRNST
jgi:hypothetical protein